MYGVGEGHDLLALVGVIEMPSAAVSSSPWATWSMTSGQPAATNSAVQFSRRQISFQAS